MASDGEEETLYCICRQKYDGQKFMIECDKCNDWFHGSCVGLREKQASDIETYHCPDCQKEHGPLVLKRRSSSHTNYWAEENAAMARKTSQTGTREFVRELKSRIFPSADEVITHFRHGVKLTMSYFEEHGFTVPILVDHKDGLGLKVPPPNFTIQDVEDHVGSTREIDVIDVARQEDDSMLMRDWTEYYNSTNRPQVLNVISLEFSKTSLADLVEPPQLVREMSWTSNLWPNNQETQSQEGEAHEKPCVQRYCLMGVKDSYTDFHIDFGGTSVWYHVLRGEKVFYLIEPSEVNLQLYETWLGSRNQSAMFFGDQVSKCYKCTVKQGQTLFIPTGWIHSVLTPIDSLVFGGNFLHNFCIELQIRVYELEKRVKTPERYMFPNYETLHWYAAKHIYKELREFIDNDEPPPFYLVNGTKVMISALKSWTYKRDYIKRDKIPSDIQYGKLLKDLQKQLRQITALQNPSKEKKKRKLMDTEVEVSAAKEVKLEEVKPEHTEEHGQVWDKVEETSLKTKERAPSLGVKEEVEVKQESENMEAVPFFGHHTPPQALSSPTHQPQQSPDLITKSPRLRTPSKNRRPSSSTDANPASSSSQRLTFRLPKAGAYTGGSPRGTDGVSDTSVYDFDEDEDSLSMSDNSRSRKVSAMKSESDIDVVSPSPDRKVLGAGFSAEGLGLMAGSRRRLRSGGSDTTTTPGTDSTDTFSSPEKKLKLKIPAGRVIGTPEGLVKSEEAGPTPSTASTSAADTVSSQESDDDEDSLVVDESPRRRKQQQKPAVNNATQGTLKLKLSVDKSQVKEPSSFDTSQDSSFTTNPGTTEVKSPPSSPSQSAGDDYTTLPQDHDYTSVTGAKYHKPDADGKVKVIKPHKTKGPIFDASQFRDTVRMEGVNKASPLMRDAIQGMLSMSQIPSSTLQTSVGSSPFLLDRDKSKASLRLERESKSKRYLLDEGGEFRKGGLPTVFKDDQYVYPTLEGSEHEDDAVFKPRGRQKKDETWNPKAKLNIKPKIDRPTRPMARKESVGSLLEDAAAKLANRPAPKREYIRKKNKDRPMNMKSTLSELESPSNDPTQSEYDPMPSTSAGYMEFASTSEVDEIFGGDLLISQNDQSPQASGQVIKSVVPASSFQGKKPKKGMATAKQRLGKILKIHKML